MKHSWGIIALLLLTGCAAQAAPAAPTPDNSIFLTQYRERFPGGTDEAGIRIGHAVCDAYKAGTTFAGEVAYIQSQNPAISAADAGYLIGASTAAYCPEFNNRH
jgi:hypothetical protein